MRVLFLTNNWDVAHPVYDFLCERETVTATYLNINKMERPPRADIIVSYCYRYILRARALKTPAVNLHNSYLPWGRGAQPLFWSVIEGEPCGVSIHWMDTGLDTGEVIAKQTVAIQEELTFRQLYEAQHRALYQLFRDYWDYIRNAAGSYHTAEDFDAAKDILGPEGWDCPVGTARRRWRA